MTVTEVETSLVTEVTSPPESTSVMSVPLFGIVILVVVPVVTIPLMIIAAILVCRCYHTHKGSKKVTRYDFYCFVYCIIKPHTISHQNTKIRSNHYLQSCVETLLLN